MSLNPDLRKKHRGKIKSIRGVALLGSNTFIEKKLDRDYALAGVQIYLQGQSFDDEMYLTVFDRDFIYVGKLYPDNPTLAGIPGVDGVSWQQLMPDGVQVSMFGEDVPVISDTEDQGKEELGYWGDLKKGMYVSLSYVSKGQDNVKIKVKLYLHEYKTKVD